jgi:hypothetical protein
MLTALTSLDAKTPNSPRSLVHRRNSLIHAQPPRLIIGRLSDDSDELSNKPLRLFHYVMVYEQGCISSHVTFVTIATLVT